MRTLELSRPLRHEIIFPQAILVLVHCGGKSRVITILVKRTMDKEIGVPSGVWTSLEVALLHVVTAANQAAPILHHDMLPWPFLFLCAGPALKLDGCVSTDVGGPFTPCRSPVR